MSTTNFQNDPRFDGIKRFEKKIWLSSPTMHGDEQKWVDDAIQTNWVSTVGANINEVEKQIAEYIGVKYAVALSAGTAALHLATKLAGEELYGQARPNEGTLAGKKVFCSDVTFDASINPVAYEDGEAVFIDTEPDTWNMSPEALEKAFELYPDTRLIVVAHLYGKGILGSPLGNYGADHGQRWQVPPQGKVAPESRFQGYLCGILVSLRYGKQKGTYLGTVQT